VRTLDDVLGIRTRLAAAKKLVIVGAGYIGLEIAATARQMNLDVVVLEMADRCLNRVTSPLISDFYARRHAQAGVRLLTGVHVAALEGDQNVRSVRCSDGSSYDADVVIAGIGIVPNVEIADAAGLRCENGIVVDEYCRTSQPHIYAAGDCTNHPSSRYGYRVRLESVDNAVEQARVAAAGICGKSQPHAHTPWFWSDQYDVKLQTAGLLQGHDVEVVRGDATSMQFSVWYLKGDELLAVDAINRPADFILAKRWIAERKRVNADLLTDTALDLKAMV
jgi:3-phenylpropionate/trans-cinnamate dioxygenase ferredoxin reductase subunit